MDEKAAIGAAQQGDVQAFNTLVLHYQSMAFNVAYRVLGDADMAADACQEAFLSAYRNIRHLRGESFKAWLLRIVTNACYDQLRYKKRRPADSLDELMDESEHGPSVADPSPQPEQQALRRELEDAIIAGIQTLPEDQRVTLVLADVQGLSYEEIAGVTGASLGTVKSRLSRARCKLRDYLIEQGELLPGPYRPKDNSEAQHAPPGASTWP